MRPKEFSIPVRDANESVEDYMFRYGTAVMAYNKSICRAIDAMAVKARHQPQVSNNKKDVKTIHDIISGNPERVAAFKAGKYDPFDI